MRNEVLLTHDDPDFANAVLGKFADDSWCDRIFHPSDGPVDVLKPDGTPLFMLRPAAIDTDLANAMKPVFRPGATLTENRGQAAGSERTQKRRDGTTPGFNRGLKKVLSGVAGFMDADPKFPHCRLTAYTREHTELFYLAKDYVQKVDEVFRENLPVRWAAQREAASKNEGDWSIFDTSFSTITINRNFRTACHRDAGDYKDGFGVMSALITGEFSGGVLVFPRYRVGVTFGTGDVLLADVHEVHANTPFVGRIGRYERISLVFYYRQKLLKCARAEEEFAKSREWGSGKVG
jgi:hypothetical protein